MRIFITQRSWICRMIIFFCYAIFYMLARIVYLTLNFLLTGLNKFKNKGFVPSQKATTAKRKKSLSKSTNLPFILISVCIKRASKNIIIKCVSSESVSLYKSIHINTPSISSHIIKERKGRKKGKKKKKLLEKIHSHHIQHKRKCDDGWGDNKLLSSTFPG